MTTITTGDDVALYIDLKKDGATFAIPSDAVVKAAIITTDRNKILAGPVDVLQATPGGDWSVSRVVATFSSAITELIQVRDSATALPATVEIQIDSDGKLTWSANIEILKGLIP